jgi:hypothetical protein
MRMNDDMDPFASLKPFVPVPEKPHGRVLAYPSGQPVGIDDRPFADAGPDDLNWAPESQQPEPDPGAELAGAQWPTVYDMFDAAAVPPRQWIYGRHYLRSFVSVLASAGGIGKTSLQIVEALAICTGRRLLGEEVHEPCPVWVVNLEDPIDELQRRVLAAMQHYGITPDEVRGRLFLDAGRNFRLKFATQTKHGIIPNAALVEHMAERIPRHQIGAVFIDPFVSAHEVNENDNMAIGAVVDLIRGVADATKSAIGLVHHIRKGNGEDASIDSVRGAGSLIGAARAARVINRVTEEDAIKLCVPPEEAKGIFRVDDGKANLAPPASAATYRRMIGVKIPNGDWVGVAVPFEMPDAFDGVSLRDLIDVQKAVAARCEDGEPPRFSEKSGDEWVGVLVAETLQLDAEEDRPKLRKMVSQWLKTGALRKAELEDRYRKKRPCVEVGEWASE